MTFWFWIIGFVAIVWPLLVVHFHDRFIGNSFANTDGALVVLNRAIRSLEEQVASTQGVVEEQDKLIAALWAKAYGYHPSEDAPIIHAWEKRPVEAYGLSPYWIVTGYDEPGREGTLTRSGQYPWKG